MQATLSHYRILEQIGAGGMGVVYRARDEHLGRDVALKVLPTGTVPDASTRRRFHKEAIALSKLNHPNIATVHDFDTQDGVDFLVEEYIDGLSLDTMLAAGALPEREIVDLGSQMAEGLAAAHEQGVIHRDLKPGNMRITPSARLKILDFGLATILRQEASPTAVTETLSRTEGLVGTLPYMSPEQLLGGKLDERTDIWSAGCVLYEMATGRRPFLGSGPALTEAILHENPPAVSKLNPKIDARLDGVIQRCLEKDAANRYYSAKRIAADLRRRSARNIGERRASQKKHAIIALIIALVAVFAVIAGKRILDRSLTRQQQSGTAAVGSAPYEAYLAGMKQMDRWDKAANLDSAIVLFGKAVKADPAFALGFSALGEAHWAKYRLEKDTRWIDEAEKDCRRASELNNQVPAIYVTLSRVHNGRGQFDLALEEIEKALELEPLNADALLAQAAVFASMGQLDRAEETYQRAATLQPHQWGGFYELGVFYYRQKRYRDAVTAFERVLNITPDNAMAYAALGGVHEKLGRDAEAESYLKRSLELQPTYAGYTNLGVWYYRRQRWAESVTMTRRALEINGSDWRAWSNLGLAYEWLKQKDAADEAFRNELSRLQKIADAGPDDAELQVELGLLHSRWKRREKAVPLIQAALARAPDNADVLAAAGEAYDNLGDRDRALELVRQALEHGWTLAQLENDPGQQKLLQDSRFREIAAKHRNNSQNEQ